MNTSVKTSTVRHKNFSTVCILMAALFFSTLLSGCGGYGTKLTYSKTNELYYTDNVTEEEAKALGQYLNNEGFFPDDGNKRSTQLDKEGSTYLFRMVVKEGLEQDKDTVDLMKAFAAELSENVFNGKTVDIHLCDDKLKTLRVVVAN